MARLRLLHPVRPSDTQVGTTKAEGLVRAPIT